MRDVGRFSYFESRGKDVVGANSPAYGWIAQSYDIATDETAYGFANDHGEFILGTAGRENEVVAHIREDASVVNLDEEIIATLVDGDAGVEPSGEEHLGGESAGTGEKEATKKQGMLGA